MRGKEHLLQEPRTAAGGGTPPGIFAGLRIHLALPRQLEGRVGASLGPLLRHAGEQAWARGRFYRKPDGMVGGAVAGLHWPVGCHR
jgi:hypothetical protein